MRVPNLENAARALSMSFGFQQPIVNKGHANDSLSLRPDLPGGSPLSLCEVSQLTGIFQFTSVQITKQPLYT